MKKHIQTVLFIVIGTHRQVEACWVIFLLLLLLQSIHSYRLGKGKVNHKCPESNRFTEFMGGEIYKVVEFDSLDYKAVNRGN